MCRLWLSFHLNVACGDKSIIRYLTCPVCQHDISYPQSEFQPGDVLLKLQLNDNALHKFFSPACILSIATTTNAIGFLWYKRIWEPGICPQAGAGDKRNRWEALLLKLYNPACPGILRGNPPMLRRRCKSSAFLAFKKHTYLYRCLSRGCWDNYLPVNSTS